jgi:hypothetical protein
VVPRVSPNVATIWFPCPVEVPSSARDLHQPGRVAMSTGRRPTSAPDWRNTDRGRAAARQCIRRLRTLVDSRRRRRVRTSPGGREQQVRWSGRPTPARCSSAPTATAEPVSRMNRPRKPYGATEAVAGTTSRSGTAAMIRCWARSLATATWLACAHRGRASGVQVGRLSDGARACLAVRQLLLGRASGRCDRRAGRDDGSTRTISGSPLRSRGALSSFVGASPETPTAV